MGLLDRLARISSKGIFGGLDPNARQPVFYSAVEEALRLSKPEAKSGKDWLEMFIEPARVVRSSKRDPATNKPMIGPDGQPIIEERTVPERIKIPDVRAQEMKWSGLADLLKAEPDRQFTRDELLGHMDTAKRKYAPREVYMSHNGQSEEDWLAEHEDSIASDVADRIWHDYRENADMPDYEIENVGPRSVREVMRDIELVKAGMGDRSGHARDNMREWERKLASLEHELPFAQAREARDPNTVDMFSGELGGGALNDAPQYMAHIRGGFDDIDETLPNKFDSEVEAEDAADEWIRDYRDIEGEQRWRELAEANNEHYDDVLDDFRENYPRERGTKYDGDVGDYAYTDGGKNYEELLFTLPNLGEDYSTHWSDYVDDPVIAHVRYDERSLPAPPTPEEIKKNNLRGQLRDYIRNRYGGAYNSPEAEADPEVARLNAEIGAINTPPSRDRRALAIQEMQSDWHQDGRNDGYAREVPESERLDALVAKTYADEEHRNALEAVNDYGRSLPSGVRRALLQGRLADHHLDDLNRYFDTGELPPHARPDSRVRQHSDYAGWANHNLNAALFDLPHDSGMPGWDEIQKRFSDSNLKRIEAETAWRNAQGDGVPDAPFANNVWAEMALKRMLRKAADENFDELAWSTNIQNGNFLGNRDWDGKEFYDQILVNMGNKLGKKAGVSVGSRQDSRGVNWRTMEMTPEFREFLKKGLPLFMWPLFAAGAAGGLLSRRRKEKTSEA